MSFIVYTYEKGQTPLCHAYEGGATQADAEALEKEIQAQHPAASLMVLPLEAYVSTANQFVVKETGTFEGKPGTVEYFGPFVDRAGAESAELALKPGGGHEDMKEATFEILEVTAAELAGMHVEALPE